MNNTTVAKQAKTASFLPLAQGILQRQCACGKHTIAGGQCAECAKNKSGIQRKLTIGASNDPLEREADRVADQVLAAPTNTAVSDSPLRIQRRAGQATAGTETAPVSVDRVLAGSGRPMEPALRHDMEQRFGHDFSRVRVHSGAAAEQSAREVSANAYTVGRNIVFGAGLFAPGTHEGRRLLAHELTHVVQQSDLDGIRVGPSDDKHGLSSTVLTDRATQAEAAAGSALLQRESAAETPKNDDVECRIHFLNGTTEFTDSRENWQCMESIKKWLADGDVTKVVELHGYASEEGDEQFNKDLSQRRAEIVKLLLGQGRMLEARLKITGHGRDKTFPDLPSNRRVEAKLVQRISMAETTVEGITCPPKKVVTATDLTDYVTLLSCAEKQMVLSQREMLAVFRQLYYGKPWSISKASQWDQVIPCSPNIGNPEARLGKVLFDSLQASQEVAGVDVGHVFTGLEAMLCPKSSVTLQGGGIPGALGAAVGATTVQMSNEDFATWGGDLGAGVAAKTACDAFGADAAKQEDCGKKPAGQSLTYYLRLQAPDQDLEGDIDPFAQRAQLLGIPCGGSMEKPLTLPAKNISALFEEYYLDPTSALGKAHSNAARCMLDALGATLDSSGKKITNRAQIIGPSQVHVGSFAGAFYYKIRGSLPNTGESQLMRLIYSRDAVDWFLGWLEKKL